MVPAGVAPTLTVNWLHRLLVELVLDGATRRSSPLPTGPAHDLTRAETVALRLLVDRRQRPNTPSPPAPQSPMTSC